MSNFILIFSTVSDEEAKENEDGKDGKKDLTALPDGEKDPPSLCQQDLTPSRMCKTTYNTTAPMYGLSLTSRKSVTIVQKFPDLLQQVIFETCE